MEHNAQNMKFSVTNGSKKKRGGSILKRPTTHKMIEEQIRMLKQLDQWVIDELISMSKNYPDSALDSFAQNINTMISKAQAKKREA